MDFQQILLSNDQKQLLHELIEVDVGINSKLKNRFVLRHGTEYSVFSHRTDMASTTEVNSSDLEELGRQNLVHFPLSGKGVFYITPQGLAYAKYLQEADAEEPNMSQTSVTVDKRKVFVVHGRDDGARNAMFEFLRALGLQPIEWSQAVDLTGEGSPETLRVIEVGMQAAQATVVLLTGDDEARLRPELCQAGEQTEQSTPQARPNVIFEAGIAFGRSRERTIIVEIGRLRPFSDVAGLNVVRLDDSPQKRNDLKQRLKRAGCEVVDSGSDWMGAGKFVLRQAPEESDSSTQVYAGGTRGSDSTIAELKQLGDL